MFSIIIPTMQKNKKIINMLLSELDNNDLVKEIIIIDNSKSGIDYSSNKLNVITPPRNLFVNPAWNLGVSLAKCSYIAILNDDLLLPFNLLSSVLKFLKSNKMVGIIGLETINKTEPDKISSYPDDAKFKFKKIRERNLCWGSAMFMKKETYTLIPENMKVWCGDDFLFEKAIKNKKKNYMILNSNVLHLHSLTSDLQMFDDIKNNDLAYYKLINPNFGCNPERFVQKIFSIKNSYKNGKKQKIICIFGIKFFK